MILADLIHRETGTPLAEIMLLRHSNAETAKARSHNVSIEEYTALQAGVNSGTTSIEAAQQKSQWWSSSSTTAYSRFIG